MRLFQHHASMRPAVTRLGLRLLACLSVLAAPPLHSPPAYAGTTGTTNLLMPQGPGSESQDGDYFTSDNVTAGCPGNCPLDTIYRYYIEVPSGPTTLRIQIFDADIGAGGATEQYAQRDRTRATFNTKVKYTLLSPAGTSVATETCGATATAFCADDAWSTLYTQTTGTIANGHWELDVDQSTDVPNGHAETGGAATNDINAFGIQADTGTQGTGTELPVYYLAQNQIGMNPPQDGDVGTKTYTFYPYITSGCSFTENDFDFDLDNGTANQNVGSMAFTSRTGSFTKNFAATSLSQNDVWATNTVSGYTSASDSIDYGIWTLAAAISNYNNDAGLNGNYANVYLATYAATAASTTAPANNSPTVNTFRVYFSASTGGAPVKPYMEQQARYVFLGGAGGPNPPVVGSTTSIQVTVQVVNPTASPITFSATNLVKVQRAGRRRHLRRQRRRIPGHHRHPAGRRRHRHLHLGPRHRRRGDQRAPHLPGRRQAHRRQPAHPGRRYGGVRQRHHRHLGGRDRQHHADSRHPHLRPPVRGDGHPGDHQRRRGGGSPRHRHRPRRRGGMADRLRDRHRRLRPLPPGRLDAHLAEGQPDPRPEPRRRAPGRHLPRARCCRAGERPGLVSSCRDGGAGRPAPLPLQRRRGAGERRRHHRRRQPGRRRL